MHASAWDQLRQRRAGFTLWNLSLFLVASMLQSPSLLAISFASSLGVITSFHLGWIQDTTGVARLIKRNGLPTGLVFHFYNFIMHILPPIVVALNLYYKGWPCRTHHGLIAAIFHLTWGLIESRGHLLLDDIYVDMDPFHWHQMWLCGLIFEVWVAPALF
ncbi:uncharacterized protein MONBRDRAFT_12060 [Monosiga brevicollis MX1]|uniref:Uncharacterized protein n=1 Tax=Monosiga brevicollis TaxID=81824 RepID=A9VB38_MONBE|nr:uncharacterized protein MONBRDRAFT_12060 [Monosiga brevicollis MX1]EDQ85272.1 predicted protein [Monosiga brevicollis MX1]|eukprot:XP_001749893.1 hypothetical protein [Monosiga brevicollis MX1]